MKNGYKQTEVGMIPEDWKIASVSSFGKVVTGGTPPTTNRSFWNGFYPWVTPTDISSDRDIYLTERCITDAGMKVSGSLPANSVLVTCIASIGKNAVLKTFGSCNQQINAIIPNGRHDSIFIYYLIEFNKNRLLSKAGITATSIISKSLFESIVFAVPPTLEEQRAIAAALGDADALIASLEALIAKKRDIKQAAMQQLLTGKTRLPGFSGKWVEHDFNEIFNFLRNGSNSRSDLSENGDVGYIHYGDIHSSPSAFMDFSKGTFIRISNHKVSNLPRVHDGDLIIADASEDYNGIGKSVEVRGISDTEVVAGLHTLLLRGKRELLSDGFKGYLQFVPALKSALIRIANGISVYGISKTNVKAISVLLPPIDEQSAIASVLSDMDAEITALETKRDKAHAVKQGMMQELLTGRIRLI
ncbi:restriction endonuclease subunit S [Beijerinckia indica]|uniref:Restriction modification system DNA specificity domain n=1 Tax=Beijerinckia indica subsp. indica (strain ATCC 9039 / DSM 1715 / NCIMB 8712) TaxID=395963 RepID=B2IJC7_BEII9|nr:restriction endonuclease subunit S [Beijerinckia indica]ACB96245.1 restriction modification system DNA specificity domain [Beijerinckia indica subsp. indica ATCC 9039]